MKLEKYCLKTERYIPLTYIETEIGKPLIIKLSDDWNFVAWLQKAVNFALVIDRKDYFLRNIEHTINTEAKTDDDRTQKDVKLLTALNLLISMLFEISKAEYKDQEKEYWQFLQSHFIDNTDILFDVWTKVLEYNTRLGKKNAVPNELQNNSGSRSMDRWRGFFAGRKRIHTTRFLKFLHEDEERTIETIRQYKKQKESERKNKRSSPSPA